jgi:hypothetical protein
MNDLERMTLEMIGENTSSPDVFTDDITGMAQIRDSLNDAIEEISLVTGSSKQVYYLNLTSGIFLYRLVFTRGQFAWVTDAWLRGHNRRMEQTDLTRLENYNPRWMLSSGTPHSYFPIGTDIIGVFPKPASSDLIIELTCVIIPERYTIEIPTVKLKDSFQWAAVHFAVGEYYASRGDAKQALYHHGQYMEKLGIQSIYPLSTERKWSYKTTKEPQPKSTD